MIVLITLTEAGVSTGPFDIYSDVDLNTPVANDVPKADLLAGYQCTVDDNTTFVRVKSDNMECQNYIDIYVTLYTTTTTSTTTTTTTIFTPTTTTTTTQSLKYRILSCDESQHFTAEKTYVYEVNDVVQFYISDPATRHCGTVVDENYVTANVTATLTGVSYPCDNNIHCKPLP